MKLRLTLALLFVSRAVSAFAWCILPVSPCEWYGVHHGQPTFVGLAVSTETVSDVVKRGAYMDHVSVQKVIFHVEEAFEGMPDKTVDVYGWGTTNDFHFDVNTRYLVYGWRGDDGKIRTGKCTRTAPLDEANEDLKFLRLLPTHTNAAKGSPPQSGPEQHDEILFMRAMQQLAKKRFANANTFLQTLVNTYPGSTYARAASQCLKEPIVADCGQLHGPPYCKPDKQTTTP